jgi:hypothetical protein
MAAVNFPEQGQWVRWLTESRGLEGEVIDSAYPSLTIKWLGVDEPQVFPLADAYFTREQSSMSMEFIPKPAGINDSAPHQGLEAVSVARAAAILGISQKAVRGRLRSGALKGHQVDGKWVTVYING